MNSRYLLLTMDPSGKWDLKESDSKQETLGPSVQVVLNYQGCSLVKRNDVFQRTSYIDAWAEARMLADIFPPKKGQRHEGIDSFVD